MDNILDPSYDFPGHPHIHVLTVCIHNAQKIQLNVHKRYQVLVVHRLNCC